MSIFLRFRLAVSLLAFALPLLLAQAQTSTVPAAPAGGSDKLSARLIEAERLASSGDYAMAETVLAEAEELAGRDRVRVADGNAPDPRPD